ncbi:ClpP/crotonase-like domain-containing protein [Pilobolus umbonatus]|nr:ClpP/crotonase-like domain-containing protein [Pilobolus umbonatus]
MANTIHPISKLYSSLYTRHISTEHHPHFEVDLPENYVIHRKISGARMFILNREDKLNALNLGMIRNIGPQLKAWDVSSLAKVILLKGVGKGRLSTGDDVLDILTKTQSKDPDALYFFQDKYALIQMIATLKTPYVAILDGYALGGALGLFIHGPFRIATEKTIFAVPEITLGAFLNSGSSFYLPRMDGEIGTYLALTGNRLEGVDTFFTGIATHYIPSSRLAALEDKLIDLESSEHEIIHQVLEMFVDKKVVDKVGFKTETREMIDRCFSHDTIEEIIDALDHEKPSTWTRETKQRLLSVSPTSLRVTLKALRKGRTMSLVDCLKMEFDLIQKYMVTKDFHEGIYAAFVSKPRRKPHWDPPQLSGISDDDIDQLYFSEPSPNTLRLPSPYDLRKYPYSRFSLPTEEDVHSLLKKSEDRLKTEDIVKWFTDGYRGKWGVKEKILDILKRKTSTEKEGLVWIK